MEDQRKVENKEGLQIVEYAYRNYREELFLSAYKLLRNIESADDIVQHTFLDIIYKFPSLNFESRHELKKYLHLMVKSKSLNLINRKRKEIELMKVFAYEQVNARESSFSNKLERDEMEKLLHYHISKLNSITQEVIYYRYFNDLSIKDISRKLGLGEINTRVILHRGRAKLRDSLSNDSEFEDK